MLIDTHCHIHEADYPLDVSEVMARAHEAGVRQMICVGTSERSSRAAVAFAASHSDVFATVGVHPHDTKDGWGEIEELLRRSPARHPSSPGLTGAPAPSQPRAVDVLTQEGTVGSGGERGKIVAIGEIGLDYFYSHSPRETQITALEAQLQLAQDYNLPVIFHVREAFDDFWPIFDNFRGLRGELHSFTDTQVNLDEGFKRGLYVGVNGISTFTKDAAQQRLFATIPLDRMLLETDAPFLTPVPLRGKINEPAFVRNVAQYHAKLRGLPLEEIANATSQNAHTLFAF